MGTVKFFFCCLTTCNKNINSKDNCYNKLQRIKRSYIVVMRQDGCRVKGMEMTALEARILRSIHGRTTVTKNYNRASKRMNFSDCPRLIVAAINEGSEKIPVVIELYRIILNYTCTKILVENECLAKSI